MTKIIAELGTLHLDSMDNMMFSTEEAFKNGADYVKVQLIRGETAWWASERQKIRYGYIQWSIEDWSRYFQKCRKEFNQPVFASIFDTCYLVDEITDNLPAFKLGWKANMMPELIERTFEYCKLVFWSLNGSEYWRHGLKADPNLSREESESKISRRIYALTRSPLTTRLYVQTIYPTSSEYIEIPEFNKEYHGLSCHYKDTDYIYKAVSKNPEILEVHVHSKESLGPDKTFSLSMKELNKLSDYITDTKGRL